MSGRGEIRMPDEEPCLHHCRNTEVHLLSLWGSWSLAQRKGQQNKYRGNVSVRAHIILRRRYMRCMEGLCGCVSGCHALMDVVWLPRTRETQFDGTGADDAVTRGVSGVNICEGA